MNDQINNNKSKSKPSNSLEAALLRSSVNIESAVAAVAIANDEKVAIGTWRRALYLVIGPGKRGKTTTSRYLLERARENGCAMTALDLEQVGRGLRFSHPECRYPNYDLAGGAELAEWLYPEIINGIDTAGRLLIDLQGNDQRFISLIEDTDFLDILKYHNICLIVVAVTGGGSDDLVMVRRLAEAFAGRSPDAFIPIFAERLVPAHRKADEDLKAQLLEIEGVAEWVAAPTCHVVWMPTCDLIAVLDHCEITYRTAALSKSAPDSTNPTTYFQRSGIKKWLEKVDLRFQGIAPCRK